MSICYPQELKQQVCAEHRQGRSVRELAADYGLSEMTIRQWVKEFSEHETESVSRDAELRRLRREVQELKEENAILKKAAAWFDRSNT